MKTVVVVLWLILAVVVVWLMFRGDGGNPIPSPSPTPSARPTPTPTPSPIMPPSPPLAKIPVCCCPAPYDVCTYARMAPEDARLHAAKHTHDLIGSACASETEEDLALARALRRPEKVEKIGRNALAMSDRSARRERELGGL